MTKRRRSGASKKQVEARFWGHAVPGRGPAAGSPSSTNGDGRHPGEAASDSGASKTAVPNTVPSKTAPSKTVPSNGEVSGTGSPARPAGIRPTPDPGALVRSLGPPPLAVDPAVSERHLTAVYEEAVRAATALAAANGLLAADDPDAGDS